MGIRLCDRQRTENSFHMKESSIKINSGNNLVLACMRLAICYLISVDLQRVPSICILSLNGHAHMHVCAFVCVCVFVCLCARPGIYMHQPPTPPPPPPPVDKIRELPSSVRLV